MKTSRIIFHIDMNCFFASCEMAENSDLIGKPVVVAHDDPLQRGIILSPNYEARKYGIKTTMKVKDAFLLCKDIIVIDPDMKLYSYYSNCFHHYLLTLTKKVEMASIDEAYVDMTNDLNGKNAIELAEEIQKHLLDTYKLPCSIGIAPNKFLAKMASDMKKPLGITVLRRREIDKLMWPLPITDMMGVGKKTAPKLMGIGINTIGQLANYNDFELLKKTIGTQNAISLIKLANGLDDSLVVYESHDMQSSVSNANTFDVDIFDEKIIKSTLKILCGTIAYRLDKIHSEAKTIGITIKYGDFHALNKSHRFDEGISSEEMIYSIAEELFDEYYQPGIGVRLISVYAQRVTPIQKENKQITIFDNMNEIEKEHELKKILTDVQKRFGSETIKKGYYPYEKKD